MRIAGRLNFCLIAVTLLMPALRSDAQVTTAILLGVVRDASEAALPGATVVVTHEGTGVRREALSDERGEFVLSALPNGTYSVHIEMTGFKTHTSKGLVLGSGQTIRQTFVLEVGTQEETVTVTSSVPLIQTSSSNQAEMLGGQESGSFPSAGGTWRTCSALRPG